MKLIKVLFIVGFLCSVFHAFGQNISAAEVMRLRIQGADYFSSYFKKKGWQERKVKIPNNGNFHSVSYMHIFNYEKDRNSVTLHDNSRDHLQSVIDFFTSSQVYYNSFSNELEKMGITFIKKKIVGPETIFIATFKDLTIIKTIALLRNNNTDITLYSFAFYNTKDYNERMK